MQFSCSMAEFNILCNLASIIFSFYFDYQRLIILIILIILISRRYSIFFNFFSKFFSCLQKALFLSCYWFRSKPPIHYPYLKFWISVSKSKLPLMTNIQDSSSVTPMLSIFFQLAQTTSARLETGAIILANSRKIKALLFCHQFCHLSSPFDFSLKLHKR